MSELAAVFNVCAVLGLIISAILACELEDLLPAAAALGVAALFAAAEFLILHAPVAAFAEAVAGAVILPLLLITVIRRIGKRGGK